MTTADGTPAGPPIAAEQAQTVDTPRRFSLHRFVVIVGVVLGIGLVCWLLGWDIRGWFKELWDTLTEISIGTVIAAAVLTVIKTTGTAYAWYWILRYAYGPASIKRREVLACYAASVALNNVVPANLGTFAMLVMLSAIVVGATFAGILGAYLVEKIFFTVIGGVVYLYLFLSVGGSFDIKFSWVHEHPWAVVGGAVALAVGLVALYRAARRWWQKIWAQAKEGGQILAHPGAFFGRVVLPEFISWASGLVIIAIFLAAYSIPVTFHTVMNVVGGNSLANVTSVTPGGVGVNQAFNVASLSGVTDATSATAYSVAQQLVTTMWNIVFAIVMVTWAFGWTGGRALVEQGYEGAKVKAAEQAAAHKARRAEKKAARRARRAKRA
jgi:uncharacterized membrane protein YbhN (UPF0104 family)